MSLFTHFTTMAESIYQPSDWVIDWSEETTKYPRYIPKAALSSSSPTISSPASWEWTWIMSLKSVILGPIVLATIIGNFFVLYAFISRKRELRSPTHFFIANLALADFLVGILAMPFLATLQVTGRWYFGQNFCYAWVFMHFWLCSSSILSTCAVCIERYIGVKYPLKHLTIMSRKRIGWMIAGVWTISGILTLSTDLIWFDERSKEDYVCRPNLRIGSVLIATVGILYIPAIIMVVLYWQIYSIATRHLSVLKNGLKKSNYTFKSVEGKDQGVGQSSSGESGISSCGSDDLEQGNPKSNSDSNSTSYSDGNDHSNIISSSDNNNSDNLQKKGQKGQKKSSSDKLASAVSSQKQISLAKRLSVLVGILLFSYIPFFTAFLILAIEPMSVNPTFFDILGWIRYFNSCLNPFIYAFAVPAYRKAFKSILKGRLCP